MTSILTFVSSKKGSKLGRPVLKSVQRILQAYDQKPVGKPVWLSPGKAIEFTFNDTPGSVMLMHLRDELDKHKVDIFCTPAQNRRKKLLLADMDSTIVTGETLDELAAYAGLKDEIAEITAEAMEGKLDFKDAVKKRVSLLKDLPEQALVDTLSSLKLSPGAELLVQTMKAHGAQCILVSGGFTFFTDAIAELVGFDAHHGNVLGVSEGKLTGEVEESIQDKFAKEKYLFSYAEALGIDLKDSMAIGDGANDIPMLKAAGLGLGYQPKVIVTKEIKNSIIYGDLTAALYAQGYSDKDIKKAKKLRKG